MKSKKIRDLIVRMNSSMHPDKGWYTPTIFLEITRKCNLNCFYCARKGTNIDGKLLSYDNFKRIFKNVEKVNAVILEGLGEPLINPDLLRMIRYISDRGGKAIITTNGTLVTKQVAKELVVNKLNRIRFSMNSADNGTFPTLRGGANFQDVCDGIRNIQEEKEIQDSEIPEIRICFVAMKKNIELLKDVILFAKHMSITHISIIDLAPINEEVENFRIDPTDFKRLLVFRDFALKLGINCDVVWFQRLEINQKCFVPWISTHIDMDGYVTPCDHIWTGQMKLGDIKNTPLREIWNGIQYREFRKNFKSGTFDACKKCRQLGWRMEFAKC